MYFPFKGSVAVMGASRFSDTQLSLAELALEALLPNDAATNRTHRRYIRKSSWLQLLTFE